MRLQARERRLRLRRWPVQQQRWSRIHRSRVRGHHRNCRTARTKGTIYLCWVAVLGLGRRWSIITLARPRGMFLGVVRCILGCWRRWKVWPLTLSLLCVRHVSVAIFSVYVPAALLVSAAALAPASAPCRTLSASALFSSLLLLVRIVAAVV